MCDSDRVVIVTKVSMEELQNYMSFHHRVRQILSKDSVTLPAYRVPPSDSKRAVQAPWRCDH